MAEAVGLFASVVQVVSLGCSAAQKLHHFANSISKYPDETRRLARHVEQNSRLLERVKESLVVDQCRSTKYHVTYKKQF